MPDDVEAEPLTRKQKQEERIARRVLTLIESGGAPALKNPTMTSNPIPVKHDLEKFFLYGGFCLSFAQWVYEIMSPDPNFYVGSGLLFLTVLFGLLAVLKGFPLSKVGTVVTIVLFIAVFIAVDCSWRHQISVRAKDKLQLQQSQDRKEVYKELTANMDYAEGDDPTRSEFQFVNGGSTPIVVTDVCTWTESLDIGDRNGIDRSRLCLYSDGETHHIRDGGDGQVQPFLSGLIGVPAGQLTCADLTVTVKYHLDTQPDSAECKQFRFASRWYPRGIRWRKEDVEDKRNFCRDEIFQSPGHIPPQPSGVPDYTVTFPSAGIGGAWQCGAVNYGPYRAGAGASLQQAVNDVEACKTNSHKNMKLVIPPGRYIGHLVVPQTSKVKTDNWIIIQSTEHDKVRPDTCSN
jgi:hypothetical protein